MALGFVAVDLKLADLDPDEAVGSSPRRAPPPTRPAMAAPSQPAARGFPAVEIFCAPAKGGGGGGASPSPPPTPAGSRPEGAPSPPIAEGSPALGTKIEGLRVHLEDELGDEKLIQVYNYLRDIDTAADSEADETQQFLERVLGDQIHLARSIHKLLVMEDAAFA